MYPVNLISLSTNAVLLAFEAQTVMALRLMAMAGLIPQKAGENTRMVSEKLSAMNKANAAASKAIMAGKSPDQVISAAMAPLSRKVRANRKRLMK
jgi:hypothetical protein